MEWHMKSIFGLAVVCVTLGFVAAAAPPPIIDMHLHALSAADQGPPPVVICAPYDTIPIRDIKRGATPYAVYALKTVRCAHPIWSSADDAALQRESIAEPQRYNIIAVTSGVPDMVEA